MSRLPRITGAEMVITLRRAGFLVEYVKGSHYHLVSAQGRQVVVPVHAGRILKLGTLKSILDKAGLSVEELKELL